MTRLKKSRGIRLFFQAAIGRAYPRVIGTNREPSWVLFEVVVPLINTTAFVYLYRALRAPEEYVGFVVLGAVLSAYWLSVVWSMGTQLYWDKREGLLELYVMAPTSMISILFGMSMGGIYMSSARAIIIGVITSLLFEVRFDYSQWQLVLLVFVVTLLALYGLGMLMSSVFLLWGREAWQLALALHEPAFFLTGLNFPLSRLYQSVPTVVSVISALIPISFGLDALRQLLFPGAIKGVFPPLTELVVLIALGVLFTCLAAVMLKRMERLAKNEATLSLRWQ